MRLDPKELPPWMGRLDRFLGNLSYPMYLCHWGVGIGVTLLVPGLSRANVVVFLIAFPLVNVVSYLIWTYVEHPLQSWKRPSRILPAVAGAGSIHPAHPLAASGPAHLGRRREAEKQNSSADDADERR
jgi:peptidoglycan/LPS O-acetylase OafA/YrhL